MNNYIEKMNNWDGTIIDLCYVLFEELCQSNNIIEDFQFICENYEYNKKSDSEYKYFTEKEITSMKHIYGSFIDESINSALLVTYEEKKELLYAYKLLWSLVFENELITTTKQKAFSLYWMLIDKRLPFQNVFNGIQFDKERFKTTAENLLPNLKRISYIIDFPFEQKTETTSLIINELQKVKTLEEQAVLLVFAFDLYAKENPPEESSE